MAIPARCANSSTRAVSTAGATAADIASAFRSRTSAPAGTPLPGSDTTAPTVAAPGHGPLSAHGAPSRSSTSSGASLSWPRSAAATGSGRAATSVRPERTAPPRSPAAHSSAPPVTAGHTITTACASSAAASSTTVFAVRPGCRDRPRRRLAEARNRDRPRSASRLSSRACCSVTSSTYQAIQPSGSARRRARRRRPPTVNSVAREAASVAGCSTWCGSSAPPSSSPTRTSGSRARAVAFM